MKLLSKIFQSLAFWREDDKPAPAPPLPSYQPPRMTTGVRNKNYLNVKTRVWKGCIGVDSRNHAIFDDPAWGLRAAIITLRTYWNRHNLRTVAEILSRWAPVSDTVGSMPGAPPNSPREYSEFVQRRTGIKPNEKLRLFKGAKVDDAEQLKALVKAMASFENYSAFTFPDDVFHTAVNIV